MAEIQFERKGTPLWKVVLGLLGLGGAAWGGYELFLDQDTPPPPAVAAPVAPAPGAPAAPPTPAARP